MFGFQTLSCLHDIPVVRSSTNKLQDVYAKAKDASVLIRLPCHLMETVADKSLKIAVTVANPFVKPLRGPVRVMDDFAVQNLRKIEAKYPVINTPTAKMMNKLNEKAEPVRNVVNSVKDTTTSTIQQGKETVSNVANATVNKATDVADSVYTFCETHVPGKTVPTHRVNFGRRTTLLWERIKTTVGLQNTSFFQVPHLFVSWFQMLTVAFLLKIKQTNDAVLNQIQRKPYLSVLPQRFLILAGAVLECMMARLRPENQPQTKPRQQQPTRSVPQKSQQQFVSRQTLKPGSFVTTRQSVVVTKQDTVVAHNGVHQSEVPQSVLYPRLPSDHLHQPTTFPPYGQSVSSNDIDKLHDHLQITDVERLYSRLSDEVLPTADYSEPLTVDQQMLHARLIGAELERQGYVEEDDEEDSYEQ